jgi:Arc/MetJ family transcription regulator
MRRAFVAAELGWYIFAPWYCVPMIRRTTIELDEDLVAEARRALGTPTVRATVEVSLRNAIASKRDSDAQQKTKQIEALAAMASLIDAEVLMSGDAWR